MKKGFTLVEIVAVIVILGMIILLVTPLVIGTVNKSKDNAKIQSARSYIKAVKTSISNIELDDKQIVDGTYSIMENGNICLGILKDGYCDSDVLKVLADGDKPVYGKLTLIKGNIEQVSLTFSDKKTVTQEENGKLVLGVPLNEMLNPGLYDENDKLIYTWEYLTTVEHFFEIDGISTETAPLLLISGRGELSTIWDPMVDASASSSYLKGKLVLDDSITAIKPQAFVLCDLTSIVIPKGLTNIGWNAFDSCNSLTTINYKGTEEEWNLISFEDDWDLDTPKDMVINYNYVG